MERLNPRRPVPCLGCGLTFNRDPKQPSRKYCTWECFKTSRHVTLACTVCGRTFDSYLSEVRKREARGHVPCCSRACRNSYTSKLLGGDGTWVEGGQYEAKPTDPVWRKVRRAYLLQAGPTCEGCSGEPASEVHHLHPRHLGGDPYAFDNLMAVCRGCHHNMHAQLRAGAFASSFEGVAFDADFSRHRAG